jgi:hypothetical protein
MHESKHRYTWVHREVLAGDDCACSAGCWAVTRRCSWVHAGKVAAVRKLIELGADMCGTDSAGCVAAHYAANEERPQVLEALIVSHT